MNTYPLNPTQLVWYIQASEDEKAVFMSNGNVEAVPIEDSQNPKLPAGHCTFAPVVRGQFVGPKNFESYEDAMDYGEKWLKKKKKSVAALPPIDERALGISSENYLLAKEAEELIVRTERIVHIGMSIFLNPMSKSLQAFLAELNEHIAEELESQMPGITGILSFAVGKDREEAFIDMVADSSLYGFLFEVCAQKSLSIPDNSGHAGTGTAWKYDASRWFYTETPAKLMSLVTPWSDRLTADAIAHEKGVKSALKQALGKPKNNQSD